MMGPQWESNENYDLAACSARRKILSTGLVEAVKGRSAYRDGKADPGQSSAPAPSASSDFPDVSGVSSVQRTVTSASLIVSREGHDPRLW